MGVRNKGGGGGVSFWAGGPKFTIDFFEQPPVPTVMFLEFSSAQSGMDGPAQQSLC